MSEGIKTFVYPVKDLAKAKALCSELLGVEPDMDGLTTSGSTLTASMSVWIPMDVGGGKLIASVKDADGNVIGLVQSA
jgi:hypothetical protein